MQCTINVRSRMLVRQILAKTRNSPNSPNIIARQNVLIYSICVNKLQISLLYIFHGLKLINYRLKYIIITINIFFNRYNDTDNEPEQTTIKYPPSATLAVVSLCFEH